MGKLHQIRRAWAKLSDEERAAMLRAAEYRHARFYLWRGKLHWSAMGKASYRRYILSLGREQGTGVAQSD